MSFITALYASRRILNTPRQQPSGTPRDEERLKQLLAELEHRRIPHVAENHRAGGAAVAAKPRCCHTVATKPHSLRRGPPTCFIGIVSRARVSDKVRAEGEFSSRRSDRSVDGGFRLAIRGLDIWRCLMRKYLRRNCGGFLSKVGMDIKLAFRSCFPLCVMTL